jgi:hypothetical protein
VIESLALGDDARIVVDRPTGRVLLPIVVGGQATDAVARPTLE